MDKGLSFFSMKTCYRVFSKYIIKDESYYNSSFSCLMYIEATYSSSAECYNFIINRSDVLINGQKARKLMDRIILEAGNSLYPVSVSVSSRMEITGINNLSEIRSRWRECTQRLTEKYPSPYTNAYLSASSQNLSDEKAFIASLYNDSFFNVYFRNIFSPLPAGEGVLIKWKNFPEKDMETSCLYVIENAGSNKILTLGQVMEIISGSRGEYRMEYKIGDKKEIHAIKGEITSLYNDKKYIKQISVKTDKIITAFPMVEIQVTED